MCEPYRSKARQRPETARLGGGVFVVMHPKGAAVLENQLTISAKGIIMNEKYLILRHILEDYVI